MDEPRTQKDFQTKVRKESKAGSESKAKGQGNEKVDIQVTDLGS